MANDYITTFEPYDAGVTIQVGELSITKYRDKSVLLKKAGVDISVCLAGEEVVKFSKSLAAEGAGAWIIKATLIVFKRTNGSVLLKLNAREFQLTKEEVTKLSRFLMPYVPNAKHLEDCPCWTCTINS